MRLSITTSISYSHSNSQLQSSLFDWSSVFSFTLTQIVRVVDLTFLFFYNYFSFRYYFVFYSWPGLPYFTTCWIYDSRYAWLTLCSIQCSEEWFWAKSTSKIWHDRPRYVGWIKRQVSTGRRINSTAKCNDRVPKSQELEMIIIWIFSVEKKPSGYPPVILDIFPTLFILRMSINITMTVTVCICLTYFAINNRWTFLSFICLWFLLLKMIHLPIKSNILYQIYQYLMAL